MKWIIILAKHSGLAMRPIFMLTDTLIREIVKSETRANRKGFKNRGCIIKRVKGMQLLVWRDHRVFYLSKMGPMMKSQSEHATEYLLASVGRYDFGNLRFQQDDAACDIAGEIMIFLEGEAVNPNKVIGQIWINKCSLVWYQSNCSKDLKTRHWTLS